MGAYLSQPKTDKISTDEGNQLLEVGASSMQGWRNSQEDAHNAILTFDKNTSLFAVYDGHGGAEVSTYCADKLPQFLKDIQTYKDGQFEQALKDTFLGFDKTLLESDVIDILKVLAGERNLVDCPESDGNEDDDDGEDLAELHEESNLPLNEVLEKYKGGLMPLPSFKKIKDGAASGSKPQSPYLRGRRAAAIIAEAVNKAVMDPDSKPSGSSTSAAAAASIAAEKAANDAGPSTSKTVITSKMETDAEEDSTVSSSSSSATKANSENKNTTKPVQSKEAEAEAEPKDITANGSSNVSQTISKSNAPDSSQIKESEQNGSVTSSVVVTKEDVSTSAAVSAIKTTVDDDVSGSNDAAESKQNGCIGRASLPNNKNKSTDQSTISSTSKCAKKLDSSNMDEDSTDDDADYELENNGVVDMCETLECSSEEEIDEEDIEEEEDEEDDMGDEDDDIVEEEYDEIGSNFCANMIEEPGKDSGCTAVVALLHGRDLYVANAGDSRCVVCRNGQTIEMSLDHKPEDIEESTRIHKAGGRVTLDGRVNGGLNLSRAIGDHAYKMNEALPAEEQMISALPEIKKLIIGSEDEFMVLACDGIWNFMTSEEVVDFVRTRLADGTKSLSKICEELFDNCLAPDTHGDGTGCDNMTAVIVRFKPEILELESTINPEETEDALIAQDAAIDGTDIAAFNPLKRCASPTFESNEAENANKRVKTDGECSSTEASANKITASSSCGTAATTSTDATNETVSKECDSVNTDLSETGVPVSSVVNI
ncbi:probable protein phosphatase CG10417 [Teleopsis dalmanni]|uniref:probable protein phosphatase CG10417 n=1 Tax=Teleopsis dalmanni TaxID=139649 RepID=UPI0018CF2AFB|nr:probable protein phosphatase CG10417 [Teleopsis dalmanni]